MLKPLRLFSLFLLFSTPLSSYASGIYDGIWAFDVPFNTDYFSLHQNGSAVLAAALDGADGGWDAYQGTISGNRINAQMILSTIAPGTKVNVTISFSSTSAGIATMVSCVPAPNAFCRFSPGTQIPIKKIF